MPDNKDYIITPEQTVTLHGLFLERVRRTPEATAYQYFDTRKNAWQSLTWAQMREQVIATKNLTAVYTANLRGVIEQVLQDAGASVGNDCANNSKRHQEIDVEREGF